MTTQNEAPEIKPTIEYEIWQQLLRASVDKHHEWRSPVLVTNGLVTNGLVESGIVTNEPEANGQDNWPDARTVILRKVDVATKELVFYTDSRSPKVTQLCANPNAMLVFCSKRLNWQLRIKVTITVKTDGELVKNTWDKVKQSPSAVDYLSLQAPGEILVNSHNLPDQAHQTKAHFALLIAQVIKIDWLALNRNGHQRANINADGFQSLVP